MRHTTETPIIHTAPVLSIVQSFDPEQFRQMIYSHHQGQRLRWYQAFLDPTYDRASAAANTPDGRSKWLYCRQDTQGLMVLASPSSAHRRFLEAGQIELDDIVVTVMPDEINLTDHDQIVLLGRTDDGLDQNPDAVQYEQKTVLTRGADLIPQVGTVSSASATVTGVGTTFTKIFIPGDIVVCSGQGLRIVSIQSDTILTLESAPDRQWAGNKFSKGVEFLEREPAGVDVCRDDTNIYRPKVDFGLSADSTFVQWRGLASPAPGARYSVVYRWYPKYEVISDLGQRNHGVLGVPMPRTFRCSLVGKDDGKR